MKAYLKDKQYLKFCLYGFLKNLRFYEAFILLFFIDNNISFSQIGILYATREIVSNVFEIPSGLIADSYGRKPALLGAFILYIFSFITFYYSGNFTLLLLAMLFYGIADAFRSGTHKGIIMDYLKSKNWDAYKIEYYGHTRSWSQKGSALSALFAGILVFATGNYRTIYLVAIIPYLINFLNVWSYPSELNYAKKKKAINKSWRIIFQELSSALKNLQVLQLVNSAALHSAFLKTIKDYIQPIIVTLAVSLPFLNHLELKSKNGLIIGLVYFVIFLLNSHASKKAGQLSNSGILKLEQKTLLLGLTTGCICGLLLYFKATALALIFFILIYIIENLRKPILTGLVSNQVPNEVLTSVFSVQAFYNTLVSASLALALGVLTETFGLGMALTCISLSLVFLTLLLIRVK